MRRRRALGLLLLFAVGAAIVALLLRGTDAIDADAAARRGPSRAEPALRRESAPPPPPSLVGRAEASGATSGSAAKVGLRAAIRGVVLDPDGEPRTGSVVLLRQWVAGDGLPDGRGTRRLLAVGTRRTSGSGGFAFEDLEPDEYALEALAPPGLLATTRRVELEVADAHVTLTLGEAATVRIRVVTEEGEAIESAAVRFRGSSASTDADGRAALAGVDPRIVDTLSVQPPATHVARYFPVNLEPWQPRDTTVTLARALQVSGRIVDEVGQPVAGAAVGFLREDGEDAGGNWHVMQSAEDGSFSMGRFRPGPVQVRAGPPGGLFSSASTTVTVEAGRRDVELSVPRGVGLTVVITNWEAPASSPSGPGAIAFTPGDRPEERREFDLSAEGTAEARGLEEGVEYVLWARLNDMPTRYVYLPRVRAANERLEVRLEQGDEIRVRVRCPEDVVPSIVALLGRGVSKQWVVRPDADEVVLGGVPPGRWSIVAYGERFAAPVGLRHEREVWWAEGTAAAGDVIDLELVPYE